MDFFGNGAQFSSHQQQSQVVSRTIFVGNLSIYCSENELAEIFSSFGKIESIHLKKKEQGNLSYCFVKFTQRAAAEYAISSLNGNILHGRPLRLGWAVEYEDGTPIMKNETVVKAAPPPHAQIHVSFHAVLPQPVTESMIRTIFARFGEVKDVSIKKIQFNRETLQQSGYGFVHFPLDKEGIASAVQATETMNGNELNSIAFHCSVSHGLTRYIQSNPHLNPKPSNVMIHYLAPSAPQVSPAGVGRLSPAQFQPHQSSSFGVFPHTSQYQSYPPHSNSYPASNNFEDFDSSYKYQPTLAPLTMSQPRNEGGMFFPSSLYASSSASSSSSIGKPMDYSLPEENLTRQFY